MSFLARTGAGLSGLAGWRRLLVAFAAGAIGATGFAPLGIFPALLLGYGVLLLLLDGADAGARPVRQAAIIGWAFFFGHFLVGLHWIAFPFLVDAQNHLWQLPFAVTLMPAGLALFGALGCAMAAYFWQDGPARILVFAIALAVMEWLRGHVLTGFPWNLSAYGWGASLAMLQSASLVGAYGLSFLTIALGASLAEFFVGRWRTPALLLMLFAALFGYGVYRIATTPVRDVAGVVVRLVQPNIPQAEKYARPLMLRNWNRLMDLSLRPAGALGEPTHIVWPEAATGFPVARAPGALDQLTLLTMRGKTLMTGSDRIQPTEGGRAYYNSLYLFGPGGALPVVYDKFHLVPFGEYVPFSGLLNAIGITKMVAGEAGFSAGQGPKLLAVPGAPAMTPLICYEVIFPHAVTDPQAQRPGWFVNITDDSWFGPWAGPRQHLLSARVRAIEEGLPIARAANTGISAMIDPLGRVQASLKLNRMGVVDARLPQALQPVPYARWGDLLFLALLVTAAFTATALIRR